MTAIPEQYRAQPGLIRNTQVFSFKGYRVGCASFGISGSNRKDIDVEWFGHIPAYTCAHCGPISEPENVCTYHGSWGYDGQNPDEYENRCPSCGSEECGENDDPNLDMKVILRYSIHRNPNYRS